MKTVLNVGCGGSPIDHSFFPPNQWREVRLDIDPNVKPHIVASVLEMGNIGQFDAIYSSHNIEHVYSHQVPILLSEFFRVLKPGGKAVITCPDLKAVAAHIGSSGLEVALYESPAGPITALDILYGHRGMVATGNEFYAHKTGFTAYTLGEKLKAAEFVNIEITSCLGDLALWAKALKQKSKPSSKKKR